jgi:Putative prokaryotic signal transducing protein
MTPPEQERARVAGVYSAMSDEELGQVAGTAYDLSDEAHQALEAEISRRGLTLTLAPDPGVNVYEENDLVTVRQFLGLSEALLAKSSLESAGIESQLLDENIVRLYMANVVSGIRLKVHAEDLEAANEILNQTIPENFEGEGGGS